MTWEEDGHPGQRRGLSGNMLPISTRSAKKSQAGARARLTGADGSLPGEAACMRPLPAPQIRQRETRTPCRT